MAKHALSKHTLLRRNAGLSAVEMDGQFVMLDVESGAYFAIDAVGGAVWRALEEAVSFGHLIDLVVATFEGAKRSEVEADLREFIPQLLANGLVEEVSPK